MIESVQEWTELSREEIFRRHGRGIEKVTFRLPSGKESDFSIFVRHESTACVALTDDKQVILVRQFRPGPKQVLLELPGGGVGPGEDMVAATKRELLEETGYEGVVTFVTGILPDAYSANKKNALVVQHCRKVAEPKLEDNGERVEVVLMALSKFRDHLRSGQLTDVEIGYLGLDFLGLL